MSNVLEKLKGELYVGYTYTLTPNFIKDTLKLSDLTSTKRSHPISQIFATKDPKSRIVSIGTSRHYATVTSTQFGDPVADRPPSDKVGADGVKRKESVTFRVTVGHKVWLPNPYKCGVICFVGPLLSKKSDSPFHETLEMSQRAAQSAVIYYGIALEGDKSNMNGNSDGIFNGIQYCETIAATKSILFVTESEAMRLFRDGYCEKALNISPAMARHSDYKLSFFGKKATIVQFWVRKALDTKRSRQFSSDLLALILKYYIQTSSVDWFNFIARLRSDYCHNAILMSDAKEALATSTLDESSLQSIMNSFSAKDTFNVFDLLELSPTNNRVPSNNASGAASLLKFGGKELRCVRFEYVDERNESWRALYYNSFGYDQKPLGLAVYRFHGYILVAFDRVSSNQGGSNMCPLFQNLIAVVETHIQSLGIDI